MMKTKGECKMNQAEIGKFIAKCRKDKKLTQAQLADKLNITDRAVSKWETGKSMPDSSIMLELCQILGISVNELLSAETVDQENYEKKADENLIALKRKDENHMTKNILFSILFSATLIIAMMVCLICNIAISGALTWAMIPISSIVFAWVISFPVIVSGKKGFLVSLISLSIFIIPYLYLLSRFTKTEQVFTIGTAMAVISVAFLWIIAGIFSRIGKSRKFLAFGVTFLCAIGFLILVNDILFKMIHEPLFDIWDIFTACLLLVLAFVSFFCNHKYSH